MNLLTVDDHPTNRKLLQYQLEAEGHTVFEAPDGVAALAILHQQPVDAVISDFLMPRMDGYRLCYEIRKHKRLKHLPFIIYTATYTSPSDEELALDVGADKYLRKPAEMDVILAAVKEVSNLSPLRHDAPRATLTEAELMKNYSERLVKKLVERNAELSALIACAKMREEQLLSLEESIEGMLEGIQIIDRQWRYVYLNAAAARQGRQSPADLVGRTMMECYPGIEITPLFGEIRAVMETRSARQVQHEFAFAGGTMGWFELSIEPDPTNGVLIRSMDITACKQAEEALLEAGALQGAIFNSANISCIATDAKGVIQIFNVGAERMLGYAGAEATNRFTPADLHDPEEMIARARALSIEFATPIAPSFEALAFKASRGIEDIYELTKVRKDGSRFPAIVSVTALRDPQDAIIGYLLTGTDNTARTLAEEERRASDQRYRALFENAPDGILIADPEGRYLDANESMCRMLGYSADELIGLYASDIVAGAEIEHIAPALDLINADADYYREWQFRRKDGSLFAGEVIAAKMPDGNLLGMVHDVTLHKRAEREQKQLDQRLRDQQYYTRSLVEFNIDALTATDPLGIITDVNKEMEALTGYTRDELIGAPFKNYFTDSERAEAAIRLVLSQKKLTNYELTVRSREGKETIVSYNATTIYDRDRNLQGVFASARDLTEHREYEESLRHATLKAEQANRAKSEFLVNMSHEIRTPMNAVIGLSYLLGETSLNEQQSELLGKVKVASKSLLVVLNNVLDLSKIEAGELIVEHTAFLLRNQLKELTDVMSVQAEAKGIVFEVEVADDIPAALEGDAMHLNQILTNLLSNATKFTERGGVKLRVRTLATTPERATLSFAVHDTGIGIEPEVQARLFTPFVQADASITRRFGGTGLGLSIVKRLVTLMGGEVALKSTPGLGSEFTVVLDFALASPAALATLEAAPAGRGGRALIGVRVLVVDDSDINLDVTKRILELQDAQVFLANNGQEAFELLQAKPHTVDVVLMDVQMPVLDGHGATRRIRLELGLPGLPIIALTASALSSERRRATASGMDDYLIKPFDPQLLVSTILRYVKPANALVARQMAGGPQTPEQPTAAWPEIEGIDSSAARARLGYDAGLFRSMLKRLLDDFSDVAIPTAADDAVALAVHGGRMHKLRGSAGTLGANAIQKLAAEAEAACAAGEVAAAARLARKVVTQLQQLYQVAMPVFAAAQAQAEQAVIASSGELDSRALADLLSLLRQQNLSAISRFSSLSPQLRRHLNKDLYQFVRDHVNEMQFIEAADALEANTLHLQSLVDDTRR